LVEARQYKLADAATIEERITPSFNEDRRAGVNLGVDPKLRPGRARHVGLPTGLANVRVL